MFKILVVDDDNIILQILDSILGAEHIVQTCTNGETALKILEEFDIDLILLDINMPDMSGYEVAKLIKLNKKTKHLPVIFLTALTSDAEIEKGFELGAVDYILKPIKKNEVKVRVKSHLKIYKLQKKLLSKINRIDNQKNIIEKQSKIVALSEMLDSVAHQWKQPISIIKLKADLLGIEFQAGEVNEEYINKYVKELDEQIVHMSSTLDEFRSFFDPNKQAHKFNVSSLISSTLDLISADMINEQIIIESNTKNDFEIECIENELKHVLLNLISNSKHAFKNRNIYKKAISINLIKDKNVNILEYKDNAGGIPDDVASKLFKENVTSKFTETSTGKGMIMSKLILEKFGYEISFENCEDGVCFSIKFN